MSFGRKPQVPASPLEKKEGLEHLLNILMFLGLLDAVASVSPVSECEWDMAELITCGLLRTKLEVELASYSCHGHTPPFSAKFSGGKNTQIPTSSWGRKKSPGPHILIFLGTSVAPAFA